LLAVVHVVLRAFLAASLTDLGAEAARGTDVFAAAGHEGYRQLACLCAVGVQPYAADHVLDVRFLQAAGRAMVARNHARMARGDAVLIFLVFFVGHATSLGTGMEVAPPPRSLLHWARLFTRTR